MFTGRVPSCFTSHVRSHPCRSVPLRLFGWVCLHRLWLMTLLSRFPSLVFLPPPHPPPCCRLTVRPGKGPRRSVEDFDAEFGEPTRRPGRTIALVAHDGTFLTHAPMVDGLDTLAVYEHSVAQRQSKFFLGAVSL